MSRARPAHRRAATLLAALALAAAACGGDEPTPVPPRECLSGADCTGLATACTRGACTNGHCGTVPAPAGTVVGDPAAGDCQREVCDGQGAVVSAAWDADVHVDGNACTKDQCASGAPSNPFEPDRTACAQDGGTLCSQGACVECLSASDCGGDTECATWSCAGGVCSQSLVPYGTALAGQTAGDCKEAICDGTGETTTRALGSDVPADDGNACTSESCAGSVPTHAAVADGATCSGPDGGVVCSGGRCAQCLVATTCAGEDTECKHRTCTSGTCEMAYEPYGTAVSAQIAGDCKQDVCNGAGLVVSAALTSDLPADDGIACTDRVCTGATPSSPSSAAGTACAQNGGKVCDGNGACVECNAGADCTSLVCASHVCQAATCSDSTKNGAETGTDCGGGTCPLCGTGQGCLAAADCTSGVCSNAVCAYPSCNDGVKNGTEADVDCGPYPCSRCATGKSCGGAGDCASASCVDGACAPPRITRSTPADGATDVTPATLITLYPGANAATGTVTVQSANGACSGSVQLSADGFASCLAMSVKFTYAAYPVVQPSAPLAPGTTYRLRTTAALVSVSAGPFAPYEATFTTADGGACAGSIVISQVYPLGGLSSSSTYANDFVELHNNGPTPVNLDGLSIQYPNGSSAYYVTPLSGTLPAGGYLLVQEAGGSGGVALPSPDATGTIQLATSAYVTLVSTTAPFTGYTCPTGYLDLAGWRTGTTSVCSEGSAPVTWTADGGAALARAGGGCADGNGNALDFATQLVVPRNTASAPYVCGCSGLVANGTGSYNEMDRCNVETPIGFTVAAGQAAGPVYGRVYEFGITDPAGAPALVGELGYGPAGSDPRWAAGWTFVPATFSRQANNDDEFQATFTAPATGSYGYVYRFRPLDVPRWTYCDPNGAGSTAGYPFEPNSLPTMTVTP